ncbi:MAG: hypothetical protein KTR20_15105 [Cellvibrionaceae bacterium]|nr:hypothetical protein [Cellvibrionaceae bacterium]
MTQVYIIAGIIMLISVLICYIFIRQTIVKRRRERARLHRALDKRAKDLIQMLNAFPTNFLPRDLLIFLFRCIVDVYEQLSKLAPDELEYLDNFKLYTAQMETAMRAPKDSSEEVVLQSSSQINEIRQYLNYLGRFLQKWMQRGNISAKQYGGYKELIKRLIVQLMVDNYTLSAKQATQMDKAKLAIHYYMLAKNMLVKEGLIASRRERLQFIDEEIQSLEQRLEEEGQATSEVAASASAEQAEEEQKQWEQFEEEADWKKKNVYD